MHPGTKWLFGMIVLVLLIPIPGVIGLKYPYLLPYTGHKLLHILGAILFLGNIIASAIWMTMAARTENSAVIHFAARAVHWMDVFLTGPGVILLLYNGMTLATRLGGIYELSWITAGFILLGLTGMIWVGFLIRYQIWLYGLVHGAVETGSEVPNEFYKILRRWNFWGAVAVLLPILATFFMVTRTKPW